MPTLWSLALRQMPQEMMVLLRARRVSAPRAARRSVCNPCGTNLLRSTRLVRVFLVCTASSAGRTATGPIFVSRADSRGSGCKPTTTLSIRRVRAVSSCRGKKPLKFAGCVNLAKGTSSWRYRYRVHATGEVNGSRGHASCRTKPQAQRPGRHCSLVEHGDVAAILCLSCLVGCAACFLSPNSHPHRPPEQSPSSPCSTIRPSLPIRALRALPVNSFSTRPSP